jgi:hypothetical protein
MSSSSARRPTPLRPDASAFARIDEPRAARDERGHVGLRGRVPPHVALHRGRQHQRGLGGERGRGDDVVGEAVREPRDRVRRRGRDDERVDAVRELDVLDLARAALGAPRAPQVGVHRAVRERLERERRDEAGRGRGERHLDLVAALGEAPDELERLVRRDAPGDAEQDLHGASGTNVSSTT